jgi:integrase
MGDVVRLPDLTRHRRAELSKEVVQCLRVDERIYDSSLGGFYVQRGKTETISFRVLADLPKRIARLGKSHTLDRTIGRFPAMTVQAARREAQRVIGLIKSGLDPKAPQRAGDSPTLRDTYEDYRDDYLVKKERRESTKGYYEDCFQRLVRWHNEKLSDLALNPLALKAEHARLARKHGRKGQLGRNAADSTMNFLAILYYHAQRTWPNMPAWPRRAVVKYGRRSRASRGMGPAHLAGWYAELQNIKSEARRELLLFICLSGLRSNDARSLTWENFDCATMSVLIPEPKGGPSRAFRLPVTAAMLACMERGSAGRRAGWVFPSSRSPSGRFEEIRAEYRDKDHKRCFVKTGHDLRHTFVNMARAAGVPKPAVAVLLNHRAGDVTEQYHDADSTPLYYAAEMQKISDAIMKEITI